MKKIRIGRRGSQQAVAYRYSMVIRWSDEDEAFIVTLPEFGDAKTHGETYEKAARQGRLLIESFLMWYEQHGTDLPEPRTFSLEQVA